MTESPPPLIFTMFETPSCIKITVYEPPESISSLTDSLTFLLKLIVCPVTIVVICVSESCPTSVPEILTPVAKASWSSSFSTAKASIISSKSSKKFTSK